MNDRREESLDTGIDTVLQALRKAEPDPAMQARLLLNLQRTAKREVARGAIPLRPHPAALVRTALPWRTAATVLLALGGTLILHRPLGESKHADASSPAAERSDTNLAGAHIPRLRSETWGTHDLSGAAQRVAHVSQRHGVRLAPMKTSYLLRREGKTSAEEQSVQPPLLPLSEQERLLLRLVHRERPIQLALLTGAAADESVQRDKDSVLEFFAVPPSLQGGDDAPPLDQPTGQP